MRRSPRCSRMSTAAGRARRAIDVRRRAASKPRCARAGRRGRGGDDGHPPDLGSARSTTSRRAPRAQPRRARTSTRRCGCWTPASARPGAAGGRLRSDRPRYPRSGAASTPACAAGGQPRRADTAAQSPLLRRMARLLDRARAARASTLGLLFIDVDGLRTVDDSQAARPPTRCWSRSRAASARPREGDVLARIGATSSRSPCRRGRRPRDRAARAAAARLADRPAARRRRSARASASRSIRTTPTIRRA